jgi:hypothetical protein
MHVNFSLIRRCYLPELKFPLTTIFALCDPLCVLCALCVSTCTVYKLVLFNAFFLYLLPDAIGRTSPAFSF